MRETRADTRDALLLAIGLHVLLFALMFAGLWWTRSAQPSSAAGSPVEATLVDADALSESMREVLSERPEPVAEPVPEPLPEPVEDDAAPLPQPIPEPVPEDAPTPPQQQAQDFIPVPDTTDQDEVVDTPTPTPSDEQKLQEEKRRQAQVDLTEKKRQEEAERKRRLAAEAKEREEKLAEIRRKRAAANREAELAAQKLKQIADARAAREAESAASSAGASAPAGNGGTDTGLQARYAAALTEAILAKWTRPETVPLGARCTLVIRQLPGGEVMSAEVSSPCAYDEMGRRSIEAAVLKAQPLPYAGFEKVFARTLTLNFVAQDR
ncbi:membrane protein TolA [Lysobacter arseniciresistens ZS79]|uniref:Membrane protein TolA n=1 Tax=Lysobacter arseniciresistens ZS79 TaxID=913325 RepID=A0A0A0F094_9GAMM|nr:cell envelope integrity protein TolA [Lysobacter arseniciresistens]KGM56606.1 membrane protein TolA [Lysobacter arseniciresistens ZS79]